MLLLSVIIYTVTFVKFFRRHLWYAVGIACIGGIIIYIISILPFEVNEKRNYYSGILIINSLITAYFLRMRLKSPIKRDEMKWADDMNKLPAMEESPAWDFYVKASRAEEIGNYYGVIKNQLLY